MLTFHLPISLPLFTDHHRLQLYFYHWGGSYILAVCLGTIFDSSLDFLIRLPCLCRFSVNFNILEAVFLWIPFHDWWPPQRCSIQIDPYSIWFKRCMIGVRWDYDDWVSEAYLENFASGVSEEYIAIHFLSLVPIEIMEKFVLYFTFNPQLMYIFELDLHEVGF